MTYLCVTCSKMFSTKSSLNRHIKTVHLQQQQFKCNYCDKSFGQNSSLQTHIKMVHLKLREFNCSYCEKSFGENGQLQRHIRTVHFQQRTFKCNHCEQLFGRSDILQRHIKSVHEKQQSLKCDYCNKSVGRSDVLQNHIKAIHINPKLKSMSRLEQKVCEILNNYNIIFQREVTFKDLIGINNGHLRFDFVLQINKGNSPPYLMIEVDGQQHERPVAFGSLTDDEAIEKFEIIQQHDQIKNLYCCENGYPLLRLRFTNYKYFEEQVDEFLKLYYYK